MPQYPGRDPDAAHHPAAARKPTANRGGVYREPGDGGDADRATAVHPGLPSDRHDAAAQPALLRPSITLAAGCGRDCTPRQPPESLEDDPRIAQTEEFVAGFEKIAPRLAHCAHKLNATGPEECLWLIEHTFADFIFELRANIPSYSKLALPGTRPNARVVPLLPPPTPDAQLEMPRQPLGLQGATPSPRAGRPVERLPGCAHRADASRRRECPAKHLQPVRDHAERRKRPRWTREPPSARIGISACSRSSGARAEVRAAADPEQFLDVQYADL